MRIESSNQHTHTCKVVRIHSDRRQRRWVVGEHSDVQLQRRAIQRQRGDHAERRAVRGASVGLVCLCCGRQSTCNTAAGRREGQGTRGILVVYQQLVRASSDSPDYDALSQTVKMTMRMLIFSTWKVGSSAHMLYLHFASIGHIQLDDLDVFQRVVM